MQQGQSQAPGLSVPIPFYSQNISLWDYDVVSADDLLGSITMFELDRGLGPITKKAYSLVEFSCYYVTYEVF
jgi:hypothetical protein